MGIMVNLQGIRTRLIAARPDIAVAIGDDENSKHYPGMGRVVLALPGDSPVTGPRVVNRNPRTLYDVQWTCIAYAWIAERSGAVERFDDIETLVYDVMRAVYAEAHGAKTGSALNVISVSMTKDVESLRFGEDASVTYVIGVPVTEGSTKIAARDDVRVGRPEITVNPPLES